MAVYLDTSALAKWYLNESRSEDFAAFMAQAADPVISRLVVLEMRCLLARRRRSGHLDRELEARVFAELEADVAAGHLLLRPVEDEHVVAAVGLIERLQPIALRTLDALHLAIAATWALPQLATADRVMAEAAERLGMGVVRFD